MDSLASAKSLDASSSAIHFPTPHTRTWTLPNGLDLIVQEDHSSPVASVQVWVQTGSIHEGEHLGAGMSHILEHMLFKGTKQRGASAFAQAIQDTGGYINAYTSFDRTVYWIDIPAKGVSTAVELLADAVQNSTLPPEEYVKEQEVIRREFAMGRDDPDRVSSMKLFDVAYREHPYRHPVIGHLDIFDSLTRDDVMAYYKARYVPNNMFFVVTGDVDADAVHGQLARVFAAASRQSLPPLFIPSEPLQLGRRESHVEFPTELTRLHLAWHIPELTHPDVAALDVAAVILGSGRSSRLYKRVREELALAYSADAWCYAPAHPGLFGVAAVLDPDKREMLEREILQLVAELRDEAVDEKELAKARRLSLSHQLEAVTTMRGKASDLGSNWLLTRNLDFSRDYLAAIQRVTAADIQRVIATYCTDRNLTVSSLSPPGSLRRTEAVIKPPVAGEIQKFDLANGLRLLVREDGRLPLVSIAACFQAGLLAETPADNGITRLLARTLIKGTSTRTAEQLADQIEELGGSIGSDAGNNSLGVAVRVMRPDLEMGLQILADTLLNATIPEKAVVREKEVQLARIKEEDEEMTALARNLLRARLFDGHPYGLRHYGTPQSVAGLNRTDLLTFRDRHIVGKNGVLAVFGDVRAAEVKELVERVLAEMPPGERQLERVPPAPPLTDSDELELFKEKEQAILMVGFPGSDLFSSDNAALELIDEACSDLGSRLFVRIREEMGLAYFVGSSHWAGLVRGAFTFYLGTSPEKLDEVKTALLDEIAKLARDGLTPQEIARAKEKLIGQQEIRNQNNHAFAHSAALDELYGLGHSHYRELCHSIEALTFEEVQRVARAYFDQPRIVAIVRPS